MNKSKIGVFFFTFIILIAITPFIFSKLMNSKFNQMLDSYKKKGIELSEIENRSSYLTTDRIFEVNLTKKFLVDNGIKDINFASFRVETTFKNLPVSQVLFDIKPLYVDADIKEKEDLNRFLKKYIRVFISTNNFKDFVYRLKDIDYKEKNAIFRLKGLEGIYFSSSKENKSKIKSFYVKNFKDYLELKNITLKTTLTDDFIFLSTNFNLNALLDNNLIQSDNFSYSSNVYLGDFINSDLNIKFDRFYVANLFEVKNLSYSLRLTHLQEDSIKTLLSKNSIDKTMQDKAILKLVNKGLEAKTSLSIKDINYQKDLGFLDLKSNIQIQENNLTTLKNIDKYITATLNLKTTMPFATFLMKTVPYSMFVFAMAEKDKDNVIINIAMKDGKLFVNGKELK